MDRKIEIRPGRTINVYIEQHPTNDATAFLFHGLGGYGGQWREQFDFLKENYTLIVPDLFGHGASDKIRPSYDNPYSFEELDLDLQTLFNHFSSDTNIILGHSYGAALALSVAIDHQDRVNKLVLISPTPCKPNLTLPWMYHLPTFAMELLRPLLERKFQELSFTPKDNPQLLADELAAGRNNPMYVIKNTVKGMRDVPLIDVTMLTIPTLIISGKEDGLIPVITQQQFYKALPHHQFVDMTDASHMVMLEKPEEVNKTIKEFLLT